MRAAGDDEHDGERVDLDGRAHEQRLQHVALELLDAEHDHEHPQRDPRAVVDEREEDGERAGDDGTDDRHERAEEDQHGDRDRERHAEQERAEADADRVDRRDQQLRARVVDDRDPAGAAGAVDGRARALSGTAASSSARCPPPSARRHSRMKSASSAPVGDVAERSMPIASAPDQQQLGLLLDEGPAPARAGRRSASSVRCSGPSMRYCRNWSIASTVRACTDDHCRVTCQTTSQSRPATIASVPTTEMTIAEPARARGGAASS